MSTYPWRRWAMALGAAGLGLFSLMPALAQTSSSGDLTLSQASPAATVTGITVGLFPLPNLAQRDSRGLICTGFADTTPNHILTLQNAFPQLTVRVDSGGHDTTLFIQGPSDDVIRCGEDIDRRNPDAQIQDQNWAAGTYGIWVGSHSQGQQYSYSLSVSP